MTGPSSSNQPVNLYRADRYVDAEHLPSHHNNNVNTWMEMLMFFHSPFVVLINLGLVTLVYGSLFTPVSVSRLGCNSLITFIKLIGKNFFFYIFGQIKHKFVFLLSSVSCVDFQSQK